MQLRLEHVLPLVGFALGQRLADADDGAQLGGERGLGLAVDRGVVLVEILAALGMADDDVADVKFAEHAGGNFAGVGAGGGLVQVLRAEPDVGARD